MSDTAGWVQILTSPIAPRQSYIRYDVVSEVCASAELVEAEPDQEVSGLATDDYPQIYPERTAP